MRPSTPLLLLFSGAFYNNLNGPVFFGCFLPFSKGKRGAYSLSARTPKNFKGGKKWNKNKMAGPPFNVFVCFYRAHRPFPHTHAGYLVSSNRVRQRTRSAAHHQRETRTLAAYQRGWKKKGWKTSPPWQIRPLGLIILMGTRTFFFFPKQSFFFCLKKENEMIPERAQCDVRQPQTCTRAWRPQV